ncbi:MAG: hypothetical protein CMB80_14610 [Flammeovirgaceae bacterium]|nr:hypothetical protein [Flammeovirgaceae bacterium]|tara:strand:- start:91 stop:519 length:429 start_codon:yes stop_codon:yes gene_type:complete
MSSNRLIYDEKAYKADLCRSVRPSSYRLDPIKYENTNKCRMELGIIGGTAVSHIRGNLVDLETELRGQNRNASKCPSNHYMPYALSDNNRYVQPSFIRIKGTPTRQGREIDTTLMRLPSCQMVRYREVPTEKQPIWENCPTI